MSINFSDPKCQTHSNKKQFGLCDDPPPAKNPAYIDEANGGKWIATVINEEEHEVTFTAVDHCIETLRKDGKMDNRCDGFLSYNTTIIFVELKQRDEDGNKWIKEGDGQLRTSIEYFEKSMESLQFTTKGAYIANNERPKFRESQSTRMEKFGDETGYVLRIENRITL